MAALSYYLCPVSSHPLPKWYNKRKSFKVEMISMPGNNYQLKNRRILVGCFLFMFIVCWPLKLFAADNIEYYNSLAEKAQPNAQIIWKRSGLGKSPSDIVFLPNHTLLLSLADRILCIDEQGIVKWENKGTGQGKGGPLVWLGDTSMFAPGLGSVREIKINGASGWNLAVVPVAKGLKSPLLAGYADLLYLPAAEGLYALHPDGRIAWIMSPWESADRYYLNTPTERSFLTCAADSNTFYVIMADKKGRYQLKAVDKQGASLWSFWLGDILGAALKPDGQGNIYITCTAKPTKQSGGGKKASKLNTASVYCIERDGKRPLWENKIKTKDTLSEPVLSSDGVLYCTTVDHLYAINTVNGALMWDDPLLDLVSAPCVDEQKNRIYAGTKKEALLAISNQGRMIWSRKLEGAIEARPYLKDGYLYVSTQKGNLFKIKDVYDTVSKGE